ncbi:MAG TPA: YaiO family outer membrane beta-barrel protein [Gemmatimonadaceae bacterium]
MLLATLLATAARGQDTTRAAPRNFVAAEVGYTDFSDDTDPWQVGSLSIGRRTDAGPVIARVNRARRFDRSGAQLEFDAYPRLSPTAYIYLNAGWSESPVFPHWRAGGELYGAPARGVELSAGYRQLRFTGVSVNLLTGSAGLYRGDYWVAVRPFLRLDAGARDLSASLVARRYFSGADDYVGVVLGAGATPRDARADVDLLSTRHGAVSAGVQGSRPLASRVTATWAATGERERFQAGVSRTRVELTLGGRLDY